MSDWTEGRLRARVYRRGMIGSTYVDSLISSFDCLSASGTSRLGKIGSGELTAPIGEVYVEGAPIVQTGDIVTVVQETIWGRAVQVRGVLTNGNLRICCFVIRNIRDNNDHTVTISGDDMLSELQDYPAVTPIGGKTEYKVNIAAANEGRRTFLIKSQYNAGVQQIVISNAVPARVFEKDEIHVSLANGDVLITTIQEVISSTATTVTVSLADALPSQSAAPGTGGVFTYLFTPRIRVAGNVESTFTVGDAIRITTIDQNDNGSYWVFHTRVDGFETEQDGGTTYYWVRFESAPVPGIPLINPYTQTTNQLIATTYDTPTTDDVTNLLLEDTWGYWKLVKRDADCTIGTTYEPGGESVWDALSAITDTSGYVVKHVKNWQDPTLPDKRELRLLNPAGNALVPGTMTKILASTYEAGPDVNGQYGVVLSQPRYDIEGTPVTHIIPFGAGGGQSRFSLEAADLSILDEYNAANPDYQYILGRRAEYWVVYRVRRAAGAAVERMVWCTVTFQHIRPLNENNTTNIRDAANQLLRAAVEYLEESRRVNKSIDVEVHTVADPQPGDLLSSITSDIIGERVIYETDMLISEVRHEAGQGPRTTRLLLTKNRTPPETGEEQIARQVRNMKRYMSQTSAPTAGGASFNNNGVIFPGAARLGAAQGPISVLSQTSDVQVSAADSVFISGDAIYTTGTLISQGRLVARDGVQMPSDDERNWHYTTTTLRGIPRLLTSAPNVFPGTGGDTPQDPEFDSAWDDGGLY